MYIDETEAYRGCTIKIAVDECAMDPRREYDNLGILAMRQGGDKIDDLPQFDSLNACIAYFERKHGPIVFLKVRRYEHSGIGLKAYMPEDSPMDYPWNCPWDSGWAGIIFVPRSKVREEYSCKRIGPGVLEKVYTNLRIEVETYSCYLNGEVYGYIAEDPEGERIDSCWGYYGNDLDYCKQCAKDAIDHWHTTTQTPNLFEPVTA